MNEQSNKDNSSASAENENDVFALIKKMQQHIISIEKKLDSLMSRPPERPAYDKPYSRPSYDKPYSKPFRSFSRPAYSSGGGESRERSFPPKRNYDNRSEGEGRSYGGPRKSYGEGQGREANFNQDRPFKKKFDDSKGSFAPRKKPFVNRRND